MKLSNISPLSERRNNISSRLNDSHIGNDNLAKKLTELETELVKEKAFVQVIQKKKKKKKKEENSEKFKTRKKMYQT